MNSIIDCIVFLFCVDIKSVIGNWWSDEIYEELVLSSNCYYFCSSLVFSYTYKETSDAIINICKDRLLFLL